MNSYMQAVHDRNIHLSVKGISLETIIPSSSFGRYFHHKKKSLRTLFIMMSPLSIDLSIFHALYTTCLVLLSDQYLFTSLGFSFSCFQSLFFYPFSSFHPLKVLSASYVTVPISYRDGLADA